VSINIEKINFRDLYKLDFGGLHIDYDKLRSFSRDDLIEIRNILQKLKDILFIIRETELGKILLVDIREDFSPLLVHERAMNEFINILNNIIIDKAIEQRKNK